MITARQRAGRRRFGIFQQYGERQNEIVRFKKSFTSSRSFSCVLAARAVSSASLEQFGNSLIGYIEMLQALQANCETSETELEEDLSEFIDGPAYAAALEARRIIELAVFWVFGGGVVNARDDGWPEPGLILARHVSMYLAHVACRISLSDVGRLYARDRTTVAYACAAIEDRRDDPKFDRALQLLEWAVPVMAARPAAYRLPF